MTVEPHPEKHMSNQQSLTIAITRLIVLSAIWVGILMGISKDWVWLWAWLYMAVYFITSMITQVLIGPELREERANAPKKKSQAGEKVIAIFAFLGQFGMLVIAAFDHRLGWSSWQVPTIWRIVALILVEAGLAIGVWAMLVNKHFEATVRIQEERGHQVIQEGPYQIVRHPGYSGFILMSLVTPVVFASYYAFAAVLLIVIAMVMRTTNEDKMLQLELPGYKEYSKKTPHRLFPGIW